MTRWPPFPPSYRHSVCLCWRSWCSFWGTRVSQTFYIFMLLLRLILIMKLCGKSSSNKGSVNTTHILPAKFILEAHFSLSWDVQRSNEMADFKVKRQQPAFPSLNTTTQSTKYSPKPAPPSATGSKAELSEFMHGMQGSHTQPQTRRPME